MLSLTRIYSITNFDAISVYLILLFPSSFFSLGAICTQLNSVSYGICFINFYVLAITILFFIKVVSNKLKYFFFFLVLVFAIFFLSFLIASFVDVDLAFNFYFITITTLYCSSLSTSENFRYLMYSIVGAFLTLTALSYFTSSIALYSDEMRRFGTLGFAPNELGFISSTIVLYSLFSKKYWILPFGLYGIIQSGSRRPLAILILSIFGFIFYRLSVKKIIYTLFILSVILFLMDFDILRDVLNFDSMSRFSSLNMDTLQDFFIDDGRIDIWTKSLSMVQMFSFRPTVSEISIHVFNEETMHAHSLFIQILLEYGLVIGFVLIVFNIVFLPLLILRIKNSPNFSNFKDQFALILALYISFMFYSIYDYPFYNYKMYFIYILFVSIVLKIYLIQKRSSLFKH